MLRTEMLWQQQLGRISLTLKYFANNYETISWINFSIIVLVNILFVNTLKIDELNIVSYQKSWQQNFVSGVSMIQTSIAILVCFAYYI